MPRKKAHILDKASRLAGIQSLRSIGTALKRTAEVARFVTRSHRFADAYRKGLDGPQAAWAARKYKGHRKLPDKIMEELDTAGICQGGTAKE